MLSRGRARLATALLVVGIAAGGLAVSCASRGNAPASTARMTGDGGAPAGSASPTTANDGAPPLGDVLELDAVWPMSDWMQDDCPKDGRGSFHVDLKASTFTFAICGGTKVIVARTLAAKERMAIADLVARLPRGRVGASDAGVQKGGPWDCPLLRWRGTKGDYRSDAQVCFQHSKPIEEDLAVEDVMDLLEIWRSADRRGLCGGPLDQRCAAGTRCESLNGIVPYAAGYCAAPSSDGVSIVCLTIAYCPKGWKPSGLSDEECLAMQRPCRYVSSGCKDSKLCEKCGAAETCPDDPPRPE